MYLKTIISLVVVCSLAIVCIKLLAAHKSKFAFLNKRIDAKSKGRFEILDKLELPNNAYLLIVRVDSSELMLSVSAEGVARVFQFDLSKVDAEAVNEDILKEILKDVFPESQRDKDKVH